MLNYRRVGQLGWGEWVNEKQSWPWPEAHGHFLKMEVGGQLNGGGNPHKGKSPCLISSSSNYSPVCPGNPFLDDWEAGETGDTGPSLSRLAQKMQSH